MLQEHVSSIAEFVQVVLHFKNCCFPDDPYPELWFRGVNDESLKLLPGAYWRKECDEQSLVLSFRNMVLSYIGREPEDDWEWYYLMQHYGLPTRLLDWSESPLVALYFALEPEAPGKVPCVWMMDPVALNQSAYGQDGRLIVTPFGIGESGTEYWLPMNCGRGNLIHTFDSSTIFIDNSKPLAIFPKRYNPRIVAQRGVFTIHGIEEVPIDELLDNSSTARDKIAKIIIDSTNRKQLIYDLWTLGINRTMLFPEPQSVAEDLKRQYRVS